MAKLLVLKAIITRYKADMVILCAGAVETPRLLTSAGLVAGEHLFVDTFVTVGGVLNDINFHKEVSMNALYKGDGFILAPHYSSLLTSRLEKQGFHEQDIWGMMVKIKDESLVMWIRNLWLKITHPKMLDL